MEPWDAEEPAALASLLVGQPELQESGWRPRARRIKEATHRGLILQAQPPPQKNKIKWKNSPFRPQAGQPPGPELLTLQSQICHCVPGAL